MDLETKKTKGLWEILKGTLTGIDGEGSNKRLAAFYIITVLITALVGVYVYEFHCVVQKGGSDPASMYILKMLNPMLDVLLMFVGVAMGLASIEQITTLFKTIRGQGDSGSVIPPTVTAPPTIITTQTKIE